MRQGFPYYRLSSFYFFYFASIGTFVPYWGVYLKSLAFTPSQIGELIAISLSSKFFAPYLWGWVADHTGARLSVIRWTTFLSALSFSVLLLPTGEGGPGYGFIAAVVTSFSFFWHAALPQFEAVTLDHLGERRASYGRVRLWGSVGFIVTVTGLGWWFDRASVGQLPWVMAALLVAIWWATLGVRGAAGEVLTNTAVHIGPVLKKPEVMALLLGAFLMQMSHGPYYAFFSIYLEEHGYSGTETGQFWALGVLAEIGVFLLMHRLLGRFGAVRLFQWSLLITAVRWVLIALWVDSLPLLLLAQTMHAASYGLFHAGAIELVNRFFPGRLQGRGQALYSSVSFGLGNALGSLAGGYLWTDLSPKGTYLLAALVCLAGYAVTLRGLRSSKEPEAST